LIYILTTESNIGLQFKLHGRVSPRRIGLSAISFMVDPTIKGYRSYPSRKTAN